MIYEPVNLLTSFSSELSHIGDYGYVMLFIVSTIIIMVTWYMYVDV